MSSKRWFVGIGLSFFLLFLLAFFADDVEAQETGTVTLTWTPPTLNEDGSSYTNYGGFKIYYGPESSPASNVVDLPDITNTLNRYTLTLPLGTYVFHMTAYNSDGAESRPSNSVIKAATPDILPSPPDLTFVTIETVVYNVVKRDNGFVLVAVGTVALNTPCDISHTVNGKYVVPVSAVTWLGSVKPIVVVGTCSTN